MEKRSIFAGVDTMMLCLYLALVLIGWVNIYAAVYNDEHNSIFDFTQNYGKQLIWIGSASILVLFIILLDAKFISTLIVKNIFLTHYFLVLIKKKLLGTL